MGLLDRFRHKGEQTTEIQAMLYNGLVAAESGRQTSEIEHEKQLAENGLLIRDARIESLLLGMAKTNFVDHKNILGGGVGEKYDSSNPKFAALAILNSPLLRTSWLDPDDAEDMVIANRCIRRNIKAAMTEEEYECGGALLVDSVGQLQTANAKSAINGRIAKLVKITARSTELNISGVGKNQRPGVMQQ